MVHHDFYQVKLERNVNLSLALHTPKGRGIFATSDIRAGMIIDICPVLVFETDENENHIRHTSLQHYTYNWPVKAANGKTEIRQAIVFGLGSMFNHSSEQNVVWERDLERLLVVYKASRNIQTGEELCISYGSRLWFRDADAPKELHGGDGTDMLGNIHLEV